MENIIQRVALEHDLPVSTIRAEMVEAIHQGYNNPEGCMRDIFGDREPTPEELIAVLAGMLEEIENDPMA